MTLDDFVQYCFKKPGVTDSFPFDENTLVFKVMGKMFALADAEDFTGINLKCEPEKAVELRERYDAIKPGYHMNKTHWNTVEVNGDAPDKLVYELIDLSHRLVAQSLTKKLKFHHH